jgi:hypothetical protein
MTRPQTVQTVRHLLTLALMSGSFAALGSTEAAAQRWGREQTPRAGACFYRDANFEGDYFCVRSGDAIDELPRGMNDQISSIRTFGGEVEVTVFQNPNFNGRSKRFEDRVPNLQLEGWNDRLSSLRVMAFPRGGGFGRNDRDRDDRGGFGNNNGGFRNGSAETIVRRAYQSILNREPDPEGLRVYRNHIVDDNWSEEQVRDDLRRSAEYRNRTNVTRERGAEMTRERAADVVRRAYLSVLNREPDAGSQGYVDRVLRDRWTEQDVARELRNSAEYRARVGGARERR